MQQILDQLSDAQPEDIEAVLLVARRLARAARESDETPE
jgi:hypothetical protein